MHGATMGMGGRRHSSAATCRAPTLAGLSSDLHNPSVEVARPVSGSSKRRNRIKRKEESRDMDAWLPIGWVLLGKLKHLFLLTDGSSLLVLHGEVAPRLTRSGGPCSTWRPGGESLSLFLARSRTMDWPRRHDIQPLPLMVFESQPADLGLSVATECHRLGFILAAGLG